jgi:hypothetical protein
MATGGELGCRAHLGRFGHDFSPQPLFRYSVFMIECQNGDLEGSMSGRYRFVNIKERILRIGEESNNSRSSYIDLLDLRDIPSFKILDIFQISWR